MVVSINAGRDVSYYTKMAGGGREGYYTKAVSQGEPAGQWSGDGARALGLTGVADNQDIEAVFAHRVDPRDPDFRNRESWKDAAKLGRDARKYRTPEDYLEAALAAEPNASSERVAELRIEADRKGRNSVAYYDATYNVQKSVSVLLTSFERAEAEAQASNDWTAAGYWRAHVEAVEASIWTGNKAMLDYLSSEAGYTRVGYHGDSGGRREDAHDLVAASFLQHDNRDGQPHTHIHNPILNRVQRADGQWRTLDGQGLYQHKQAAGAVADRVTEAKLTELLGVQFAARPDGKAREVVGINEATRDLFSSRTQRSISPKAAELASAFTAKYGREPNALQRYYMRQQATLATRKNKKNSGETVEQQLERWNAELEQKVGTTLTGIAESVVDLGRRKVRPEKFSEEQVVEQALHQVQRERATWTKANLIKAVSDVLPDNLGLDPARVPRLLNALAEKALAAGGVDISAEPAGDTMPEQLRLANGRSAYEKAAGRTYATQGQLATELALRQAAVRRTSPAADRRAAQRFVMGLRETGVELGVDQAAAVTGVLTSGADVESLVGPAGTGKSFVVGQLAEAWQDPATWGGVQRKAFGLAASQVATDVLSGEGLTAQNITRWFRTQARLAGSPSEGAPKPEDELFRLNAGDLVVVDESAMADTAAVAGIHRIVQAAGAKLLLTGDHRQLGAVGAGGAMGLVAQAGTSYELTDVRRFESSWEGSASLKLRDRDPAGLVEYRKRGCIRDGGTVDQALSAAGRAWLADTLDGKRSRLVVDTNERAAQVSGELRDRLVKLGLVEENGVLLAQGTMAGVGDLVETRKVARDLLGFAGNQRYPRNREMFKVTGISPSGAMNVQHEETGETLTFPAEYVAHHVALGYASTVHSSQGLTVDTTHTVATRSTGADAVYVGLTRGRKKNTVYVATVAVPEDSPPGMAADAEPQHPVSVLQDILERDQVELSALQSWEENVRQARSVRTLADRLSSAIELATAGRTAASLDRLVAEGILSPDDRQALAADGTGGALNRLLRRAELAGHDPHEVLSSAVQHRDLDDADSVGRVLHHRISEQLAGQLQPAAWSFRDMVPDDVDESMRGYMTALADAADMRAAELGVETAEGGPQWAVEAFGPVPEEYGTDRAEWEVRAGLVAAWREMADYDEDSRALGAAPQTGQSVEHATWHLAYQALDRPDDERAEAEMSDAQLYARVRAYEREEKWSPAYVADDLQGTSEDAENRRQEALVLAAEAKAAEDAEYAAQLAEMAEEAALQAEALGQLAADLEAAEQARGEWWLHTEETRANAHRAEAELAERGKSAENPPDAVTAEEWLIEHDAHMRAEDQHREVTEHDLHDEQENHDDQRGDAAETAVADIRDTAAKAEPRGPIGDARVADEEDVRADLDRAQAALAEIKAQRQVDAAREAAEAATRSADAHRRRMEHERQLAELAEDDLRQVEEAGVR